MKHKLKFDPKWIDDLIHGEKNATIRYDLETLSHTWLYGVNAETDETFAVIEVDYTTKINVQGAIPLLEKQNIKYPVDNTETLVKQLQQYYDIEENDIVTVVVFKDIWDAR